MIKLAVAVLVLAAGLHHLSGPGSANQLGAGALAVRDASCPSSIRYCPVQLSGNLALVPGGPPAHFAARVTYPGSGPALDLRLYLQNFQARTSGSLPTCIAANPADRLAVVIRSGGVLVYSGTLAGLAVVAGSAVSALSVPGASGRPEWHPGDRAVVSTTVALDRAADNSYMGCSSHAELAWSAVR